MSVMDSKDPTPRRHGYLRFFEKREEARAHMEARNRASKDGTIHVLVDGPQDNYAVVDLDTAIDIGGAYEYAGPLRRAKMPHAILAARIVLQDEDGATPPASDDAATEAVKALLARWGLFWDPSSTRKITSPAAREWYADRTMLSIIERVRGEAGR